jgi:hypothetical protein
VQRYLAVGLILVFEECPVQRLIFTHKPAVMLETLIHQILSAKIKNEKE